MTNADVVNNIVTEFSKATSVMYDTAEKVAVKLSEGALHVYWVLVRQVMIEGLCDIMFAVALLIGGILAIKFGIKCYRVVKIQTPEEKERKNTDVLSGLCWVIGVITLIIAVAILRDSIPQVVNPEAYVIKDMISTLSNNVPQ